MAVRRMKAYGPVGAQLPRYLKTSASDQTPVPAATQPEDCTVAASLVITTPTFELSSVAVVAGDGAASYPQADE